MTGRLPRLQIFWLDFECLRDPPPAARIPGKLIEVLYANLKEAGLPNVRPCACHLLDAPEPTPLWPVAGRHYVAELVVRADDMDTWRNFSAALSASDFGDHFHARVTGLNDLALDAAHPADVPHEI